MAVSILLDIFWSHDNHVYGLSHSNEIHVNLLNEASPGDLSLLFYDEEIEITMRTRLAPYRRPEQDDALRVGHFDDAFDDGVENREFHEKTG